MIEFDITSFALGAVAGSGIVGMIIVLFHEPADIIAMKAEFKATDRANEYANRRRQNMLEGIGKDLANIAAKHNIPITVKTSAFRRMEMAANLQQKAANAATEKS